ncbi:MAG: hypothetical protein ACK5KP_12905 [Paludibacteraceae bacterium]
MRLLLFLLLIASQAVYTQNLLVRVSDKQGALPYPEIELRNKLHKIGTEKGELEIPIKEVSIGDTLIANYLGYYPAKISITADALEAGIREIILEEQIYVLNELVVKKNDFNAASFYNTKRNKKLLPYYKDYRLDVAYDYQSGNNFKNKGVVSCKFKVPYIFFDSVLIFQDSLENAYLNKSIKRAIEISYARASYFCKRRLSNYYCDYKGEKDNMSIFLFSIRPLRREWRDISSGDDVSSLVSVDENGIIRKIETTWIPHHAKSVEQFNSYILQTDYGLLENKLVPEKITLKLFPSTKTKNRERIISIRCYNHTKL